SGESGPRQHGELARSALPASRSQADGTDCADPFRAEAAERTGQVHFQAGATRRVAAGSFEPAEEGLCGAGREMVSRRAERVRPGHHVPQERRIAGPGLSGPVLEAASERATGLV